MLHKLIKRQLKRSVHVDSTSDVPDQWREFIDLVNEAYHQSDVDRHLLERSLDISSQELVQANSEMLAIFQAFPDMFFHVDEEGTILEFKGSQSTGFYIETDKLVGSKIKDFPLQAVGEKFQKALDDVKKSKMQVSLEYKIDVYGTDFYYETRMVPMAKNQIFLVIRDISERKKADNKVLERSKELEIALKKLKESQEKVLRSEKLAAVGQLASGMGHELRNPLGAIRNAIYYVRDSLKKIDFYKQDPTVMEFLDLSDREIRNATTIINELLDYSRVGKLVSEPTDLNLLLTSLKTMVEVPSNVQVIEEFVEKLPMISVDPQRIRQVFINMINNAIQSMPNGGKLSIRTRLEKPASNSHEEIMIVIQDTGCGIKQENLIKIFEPLYTTKSTGTGLGLAICSGIIERHGGKISVESQEGSGSCFTVKLPIQRDGSDH